MKPNPESRLLSERRRLSSELAKVRKDIKQLKWIRSIAKNKEKRNLRDEIAARSLALHQIGRTHDEIALELGIGRNAVPARIKLGLFNAEKAKHQILTEDDPVDYLDLSGRALHWLHNHCLRTSGCKTIGAVLKMTEYEMWRLCGAGPVTLFEVRTALKKAGFKPSES